MVSVSSRNPLTKASYSPKFGVVTLQSIGSLKFEYEQIVRVPCLGFVDEIDPQRLQELDYYD